MKIPFRSLLLSLASLSLGAALSLAQNPSAAGDAAPSTELTIAKYVAPAFPEVARMEGVLEGSAVVVFSHDGAGRVTDALVVESTHPAFAREAADAVRQWRISAHAHEGRPCRLAHGLCFSFHNGGVVNLAAAPRTRANEASANRGNPRMESSVVGRDELDLAPKTLSQPMPVLPAASATDGRSDALHVSFFIDEKGRVRVPSIVTAVDPVVAEAVLAALEKWRYEAPRKGGKTVAAMNEVAFTLKAGGGAKTFAVAREIGDTRAR
jgi:TonB family protein